MKLTLTLNILLLSGELKNLADEFDNNQDMYCLVFT